MNIHPETSSALTQIHASFAQLYANMSGLAKGGCVTGDDSIAISNFAPGLVYSVSYRGEVVQGHGFGVRRCSDDALSVNGVISGEPMELDTPSRIISMTKSFVAAAVLQLRDRGLLDLECPLEALVPKMELNEIFAQATLKDILGMLLDLPKDDPWVDRCLSLKNEEIDPFFARELLRVGYGNVRCSYSNLSYILAGRVIGQVSGRSCMKYISEEILKPLGLNSTFWNPEDAQLSQVAIGYREDCWPPRAELFYPCLEDCAAFGGLWSSVKDLALWLEFLRADGSNGAGAGEPNPYRSSWENILRAESRRELWKPLSQRARPPFRSSIDNRWIDVIATYGMGLQLWRLAGEEYISHAGGMPGYGSFMISHVGSGWAVSGMCNGTYCAPVTTCFEALEFLVRNLPNSSSLKVKQVFEPINQVGADLAKYLLSDMSDDAPELFAPNFWLDNIQERFVANIRAALLQAGEGVSIKAVNPISGFAGEIELVGKSGRVMLEFQLTPYLPAQVLLVYLYPNAS